MQLLWLACVLAAVCGAITGYSQGQSHVLQQCLDIAAYSIALRFCMKIQGDYKPGSTMLLSWQLMSVVCGLSIVRHSYEAWLKLAGWDVLFPATLTTLRQIPISMTLVVLTAALVAMWSAFSAIGLGVRFHRVDLIGVGAILTCVPFIFSLRENMTDTQSAYSVIRHIQSASPLLLGAPALVAVGLHRISHEMGQGQLAVSLRYLVASLLIRLLSLWLTNSPAARSVVALGAAASALFWASHWIFALGVYQRWRLTAAATALAVRYQTNPNAEVAGLAEASRLVQFDELVK